MTGPAGPAPAIAVRDLVRAFGATRALDGVTLEVEPGRIFGVLGPDGAGKTTLLRILAGILAPTSGGVRVLGRDVDRDPGSLCDHIAYMPQRFGLYEDLTVEENIRFYADLYAVPRGPALDARIAELLAFCRMDPFRERLAGRLSGGMKQKLGLVCALIHTPQLLLLDEPTNGVDPVSRREFWKIIRAMMKGGVTVLVSTSYLDEAERCHRVAMLDRGRVICVDSPRELKRRAKRRFFRLDVGETALHDGKFRALEGLAGLPEIDAAYIMGPTLHLAAPLAVDLGRLKPAVEARLGAAGVSLLTLEELKPSLEDIFVQEMESCGPQVLGAPRDLANAAGGEPL